MGELDGKIALVTGASRGIGRAIALRYARAGVDLIVVARSVEELESLREEIKIYGRRCEFFCADLRRVEDIDRLVVHSLNAFDRIDILVNNAGVGLWAPVTEITPTQYDEIFDVNVRAIFLLVRALLPQMIERKSGDIINIASTSARWTYPDGTVYCASKFAVLGFSEALAKEMRPKGIRVTAINPGQVNTFLGGSGPDDWEEGMLNSEDVAEIALQVVTMPRHALVTEVVVWPRAENF